MTNDSKDNKSLTPPPAYTPGPSGSGSSTSTTPGQFDPQNPYHNPWSSVPVFTHAHAAHPSQQQPLFQNLPPGVVSAHHWQAQAQGPTPPGQLHIPYAYYDPRSEHSVMQADARARWRFFEAFMWVVVTWLVVGIVVQAFLDDKFDFEWGHD